MLTDIVVSPGPRLGSKLKERAMSIENVNQFIQEVQKDQSLQTRIEAIPNPTGEDALGELLKIGAEAGFIFTTEDCVAAAKGFVTEGTKELSDVELAGVVGGRTGILGSVTRPPALGIVLASAVAR
jgi:predicted ribosomally synthesized peptide with nif11-like leader